MTQGRRADLEFRAIGEVAARMAERRPDAIAIEDQGRLITYADLAGLARRAQRGLMAVGVQAGDRVAIQAPNMWQWIVAALGLHRCGAALVPINTRYKGDEAAYIGARTRAKVVISVRGFLGHDHATMLRSSAVWQQAGAPTPTIVLLAGDADPGRDDELSWDRFMAGADAVSDAEADARAGAVGADTIADILFTSGTTGRPKGAMCTHGQALRAFADWAAVVGLRGGDRYLVVAPFFHAFGYKAGWLAALMAGATILPQPVFDADAVLARIGPDRVSMLPGPPALYQTLLGHPRLGEHDLSSLRLAVTGAAVIPTELIARMRRELGFETVITGYGLTEACGIATMCRDGDDNATIAGTSGRAIPGVEVRVVDGDGDETEAGEPGEVVVRGYNVMRGYLDDPEQTAATIDAGGWLHTGDIGVMDDAGNLRITDRLKDMFIMGGFNCYPAEIERVLLQRPDIVQAAVIGVPDARMGEVGMAFVLPRQGATIEADELLSWCRPRMANFKVPRHVRVVDALPMNATGKVQKFALRELIAGDS